jgi:hypothetical protein
MIQPGVYNIRLQRRADYSIQLRFLDSNKAAINLAGWSVHSQIWNQARSTKHADFTITYTDRAAGMITMTLPAANTETLPDQSVYDVLLVNSLGQKEYYLEGGVIAEQGYTAP